MQENRNLINAKINKDDEFYTKIEDIELELKHYKSQFENKIILCNCDDPFESNFFKYFALNFNALRLKKLICTCYDSSNIMGEQLSLFDLNYDIPNKEKKAYKLEINEISDQNNDGAIDLTDIKYLISNKKNILTQLKEDGDFRSKECIQLLEESDVVVTNPPFSLWREYVTTLEKHNKNYLIIGRIDCITYVDIWPLVKNNKIWRGYNTVKEFFRPDKSTKKFGNICWWTNLDVSKRHEKIILYKKYNKEDYPKFDNYDAINVNKVEDIPCDYFKLMGVPTSFLDKYNPEQFKIVACSQTGCHPPEMVLKKYSDYYGYTQDGKSNGRTGSTMGNNPILVKDDGKHVYYVNKEGIRVQSTYPRIFIQRVDIEGEDNGNKVA